MLERLQVLELRHCLSVCTCAGVSVGRPTTGIFLFINLKDSTETPDLMMIIYICLKLIAPPIYPKDIELRPCNEGIK